MLKSRAGLTLVELLVALFLTGVVMGTATLSVLRQQRTRRHIGALAEADRQLSATMSVLAEELGHLDRDAGDLAAGEVRDTVIQARSPVLSSISCAPSRASVTLIPDSGVHRITGGVATPRAGDTLWWLGDTTWRGAEITGSTVRDAACAPSARTGRTTNLTLSGADSIPAGAPLRVTRQTRYGLYKSGDGTWQLAVREWTGTGFAAPQPVAGPLLLSGTRRSGFRYFDAAGSELASPANAEQVTRIRFVAHALLTQHERGQDSVRSDSIEIAIGARQP